MSEKPMLKTNELSDDFIFDGRISLEQWNAGEDFISNLKTIDPDKGGITEAPTVVKFSKDVYSKTSTITFLGELVEK